MIEYAGAIFLVIGFIIVLKVFKLVEKSTRVIDISRRAVADLRSSELDDDAKESAMQSHAKQLFGLFFLITIVYRTVRYDTTSGGTVPTKAHNKKRPTILRPSFVLKCLRRILVSNTVVSLSDQNVEARPTKAPSRARRTSSWLTGGASGRLLSPSKPLLYRS